MIPAGGPPALSDVPLAYASTKAAHFAGLRPKPPAAQRRCHIDGLLSNPWQSGTVVVVAQEEARTLKHNYIGTEHILLGLTFENEGVARLSHHSRVDVPGRLT
jgi:hypothetical protein